MYFPFSQEFPQVIISAYLPRARLSDDISRAGFATDQLRYDKQPTIINEPNSNMRIPAPVGPDSTSTTAGRLIGLLEQHLRYYGLRGTLRSACSQPGDASARSQHLHQLPE